MKTLNDCLIELGKAQVAFSMANRSLYADMPEIANTTLKFYRVDKALADVKNHPDFTLDLMECDDVGTTQ